MSVVGTVSGALGDVASGNPLGGAVSALTQSITGTGLNFINGWVLDGTRSALQGVAHVIGVSTTPNLTSTWFSSSYWRVAGLATLLTLPFLFAAAVHALLRSDPMLLSRAVLVQLPLALLGVSLAAPAVMLMLAATDQMSTLVAGPGVDEGARFLVGAASAAGAASAVDGSPFLAIVVGLLTVAGALALMIELLIREAAVYVVVLMLPLAFAALVWPARRVWAIRMFELLTALILSKFAIVTVLSLAGSALRHAGGVPQILMAMTLVLLSCLAPWALLRLIPFTELGAAASEAMRHHGRAAAGSAMTVAGRGAAATDGALALTGMLRRQAQADGQAEIDTPLHEDRGAATDPDTGDVAHGYGQPTGDAARDDEAGPSAAGLLANGSNPTHALPPTSASAGAHPSAEVIPDAGGSETDGNSANGTSDAEQTPEPGWWEAEDMSLPGIHLGTHGLGGRDWVPPANDPNAPSDPNGDVPSDPPVSDGTGTTDLGDPDQDSPTEPQP